MRSKYLRILRLENIGFEGDSSESYKSHYTFLQC